MMQTPIADFVRNYAESSTARLHMPGHKGHGPLGCESWDITEIKGADALYEADGIIAQSERSAGSLFGSGSTLYSTEGSSQCIRAMLYLALTCRRGHSRRVVAARNVHKAFVYAAALLDLEVVWLTSPRSRSLCECPITSAELERTLDAMETPMAVYVTSPDYLGSTADIAALAEVCHRHGTILAVDNAHGAYLHFLNPPAHPLDLGADLCCDSAHKTLPCLTGAAYLHISSRLPSAYHQNAKQAMAMFGSTSPSYLTLCSLDLCNAYLSDGYGEKLRECCENLNRIRQALIRSGWQVLNTDPLKLTVCAPDGTTGTELAEALRAAGIESEFSDPECVVLMASPDNGAADLDRLIAALGINTAPYTPRQALPVVSPEQVMSIRQAMFAPHETLRREQCLGRVCAAPTVSCPPAIPVVISGERIDANALQVLSHYHIDTVDVVL